jgi:cob(I)alamin adenosyltransferase
MPRLEELENFVPELHKLRILSGKSPCAADEFCPVCRRAERRMRDGQ